MPAKYSAKTYALAAVRPMVPPPLVPAIVRSRVRRALKDQRQLAMGREHMELLVGAARPDADLDALAAGYVEENRWRIERKWYPETLMRRHPVLGIEHAQAVKGGFVFNWLHHGRFDELGIAVRPYGIETWAMGHPRFFVRRPAPWDRAQLKAASMQTNVFDAREGVQGLVSRLEQGLNVSIASDLPGSSEVDFVGRRLLGSSGAARAACLTGRPVVVCTSHRDADGLPYFRIHEPLDPAQYADPHELLQAMLRIHEPAVLEWPESYEEPLGKWGIPQPVADGSDPAAGTAVGRG